MSRLRKKELFSLILKGGLLILGVVGQLTSYGTSSFMSSSHLLYFTNMSNLWIMTVVLVLFIYSLIHIIRNDDRPEIPGWLQSVRFIFTVAITLTFLVFSVLLTPQMISQGNSSYLLSVSNMCVHNLVPLLSIADFLLFGYEYRSGRHAYLLGLIMPLLYTAFALILSAFGSFFGDDRVPYFFFDYEANTWLGAGKSIGVVYWLIILSASVLGMSALLLLLKNIVAKRKNAPADKNLTAQTTEGELK